MQSVGVRIEGLGFEDFHALAPTAGQRPAVGRPFKYIPQQQFMSLEVWGLHQLFAAQRQRPVSASAQLNEVR